MGKGQADDREEEAVVSIGVPCDVDLAEEFRQVDPPPSDVPVGFLPGDRGVGDPDGFELVADGAELIHYVWVVHGIDGRHGGGVDVLEGTQED